MDNKNNYLLMLKNNYSSFKDWLFSYRSRRTRLVIVFYIFLIVIITGLPIFVNLFNNNGLAKLSPFIFRYMTFPFLLIALVLSPWVLQTSVMYIIWLSEKENIGKFRELTQENKPKFLIWSKILFILVLIGIIEAMFLIIIVLLALVYGTNSYAINGVELLLYLICTLTSIIFSLVIGNYTILRYGNYLYFIIPEFSREKALNTPKELSKKITFLRECLIDNRGSILHLLAYFTIIFAFGLLFLVLSYSPTIYIDTTVVLGWTALWIGLLLSVSWLVWKKIPKILQNISESRYIIPPELKASFSSNSFTT